MAPRFRGFSPQDLFTLGYLIIGSQAELPKGN